jgi:hypothetical protein
MSVGGAEFPPALFSKGEGPALMTTIKRDAPTVTEIPGFPYRSFAALQQAAAAKKANIGVNPLAAAEWCDAQATGPARFAVTVLSVLLIAAGGVALVAALVMRDYLLIAAIPAMALAFYFSNPGYKYHKQVTVAVAAVVAVFVDMLVNGFVTPSIIAAYAALTFGAVRAAGILTNSAFRRHLLSDEASFLEAFRNGSCSLRDNKTEQVYIHGPVDQG